MIINKPFVPQRLEEERDKDKSEVLPVRINQEERAWLNQIKTDLNIKSDSTALKKAAFVGKNVIHDVFGTKFWRSFTNKEKGN